MRPLVIVLAVLALALGAGGGFLGGFIWTVINRVDTDTKLGCALLQTAENAGYITREQRGQLIDKVVPVPAKNAPPTNAPPENPPPKSAPSVSDEFIKAFAQGWWDSIREDQKSGCRGI